MNKFQLTYKPFGKSAILIEWQQEISKNILNNIKDFVSEIEQLKVEEIVELNAVYCSLLVIYKSNKTDFQTLKNKLKNVYDEMEVSGESVRILWEIPVCYDIEFGLDLEFLALEKNMNINEIISLHTNVNYPVYGIGFLPGFLYLGGLSEKLYFPRKKIPRLNVQKGAVAIGGNQTGIYPQKSPGGWNIIGKTPIVLFNVKNKIPCDIKPGDEIKFIKISKEDFYAIAFLLKKGNYQLKKSMLYD
jgi:inhibitor of KinA